MYESKDEVCVTLFLSLFRTVCLLSVFDLLFPVSGVIEVYLSHTYRPANTHCSTHTHTHTQTLFIAIITVI